jgi:hypothetical protein
MKTIALAALAAVLSVGVAQAQIPAKTGIQPRTWAQVRADEAAKQAKQQRREQVRLAGDDAHRRHEAAFSQVDSDRNGRINLDEFKEAALHLEGLSDSRSAGVGR